VSPVNALHAVRCGLQGLDSLVELHWSACIVWLLICAAPGCVWVEVGVVGRGERQEGWCDVLQQGFDAFAAFLALRMVGTVMTLRRRSHVYTTKCR
jgi:hypothetical protein